MSGRVTVIGMGASPLGERALAALSRAALVVGWPEHLARIRHLVPPVTQQREVDRDLPATLAVVRSAQGRRVVLAQGDPGWFGIVGALAAEHPDLEVVPAATAVAEAFARIGLTWEDAQVVSAHACPPHRAVAVCRRLPKVAVLTDADFGPAELGAALAGLPRRLVVAERLGHPDERVTSVTPGAAAERDWRDPNVVLVLDEEVPGGATGSVGDRRPWSSPPRWMAERWARSEDGVDDGLGPEAAALVLAWLGPGLGDVVWDVGDGAVAVGAARLGAASFAVGEDPGWGERARRAAARAGVPVTVVDGRAPAALSGLPDPDGVLVAGGGHLLVEIVRTAAERARRAVVVALTDPERVGSVAEALRDAGLEVEGTRLAATPLALGGGGVPSPGSPDGDEGRSLAFLVRGGRR